MLRSHENESDLTCRMPSELYHGRALSTVLYSLIGAPLREEIRQHYPAQTRWVCGRPLPDWQRPLLWSDAQCIRFIESAWLGLHLGIYVINGLLYDGQVFNPLSFLVIDGQQRLHALERYIHDEFPVFGHRWSALSAVEQRRFQNIPFACAETSIRDDRLLREVYDRLNFSGTPHTEQDRASTKE